MKDTILNSFSDLHGQVVVSWTGCEMALSENGAWVVDEFGQESFQPREVRWSHPAVPLLQMIEVVLSLEDGRNLSVRSQHEDGTGVHGLYLISGPSTPARLACPAAEIYQTRELTELPKGPMQVVELRRDVSGCVVEMFLGVNSSVIRLLSGEVYEREEDQFEVVEVDESILIQVDGKKPRVPDGP